MYEFGRVIGNPVVLLAGDRPFSTLCAYVAMGMEKEVRGVSGLQRAGIGRGTTRGSLRHERVELPRMDFVL